MFEFLEKMIEHPAIHVGAHVGYFSGLTSLLPLLGSWWDTSVMPWIHSPSAFYVAVGLMVLSIMLLSFAAGSIYKLLRSLGWLMILPGILAIMFSFFGEAAFWDPLNSITGFAIVEPGVKWLVHHSVPHAAFLGAVYIFSGMVLIWAGRKIEVYASYF